MKPFFLLVIIFISLGFNAQNNYLSDIKHWQNQPDSQEKFKTLGDIYYDTGYDSRAIHCYQKALELKPDIKLMHRLAKSYMRYGKVNDAIKIREKISVLDSTDYRNQFNLATSYAKTGQKNKAIIILEKLVETDTLNPNYPYKIGLYSKNMNQKIDAFLEAYRRDPQHKNTLLMLVKNYKRINFRDSASYYLQKGLQIYPNETKFLRQKVINDYRKKQYKPMLKTLQKLDSLNYDDILFIKKNIGLVYLLLKKYQEAETALKQALRVNNQEAIVYYYLGKLYQATGDLSKARLYLQKAILLKQPQADKEYFELGMIAKSQKKYKTAYQYFKKAYKNNLKNADALWEMAILNETVLKKPEKALTYYKKYIENFERKNPAKTIYAKEKIKELKQRIFLKD